MKIRMLSSALILTMLASMSACGGASSSTDTTTASPETTAPEAPATDKYGREIINHSLPEGLDFGGEEIVFIVRDNPSYTIDFGVESSNGDVVNDTVYDRNSTVEEELNVTLKTFTVEDKNTTNSESVGDTLRTSVMAGDAEFDVCGVYQIYGAKLATEGLLLNVNDLPNLDFSKPWWNQSFVSELTYKDQLYFMVGSMNLSVTSSLMGYYFNQTKVTDYYEGYEFLYDLVYDGEWTYDKLTELVKGVYSDLNMNNEQDDKDFYGLLVKEDDPGPINAALGIDLVTKNESGVHEISFWSERTVNAYAKLYNLYRKTDGVYFGPKTFEWRDAFANGQGLFACCSLESAETKFRNMNDGYGILPMPKYDETQETYYNAARDSSNLTGIVTSTENVEATCAALELMNYYSYRDLLPAYFEVAMKTKYLADSDSANMFDIIVENTKVDFGEIYSLTISGGTYSMEGIYAGKMRNMIRTNIEDIASNWAQFEPTYKENLKGILDLFDQLG